MSHVYASIDQGIHNTYDIDKMTCDILRTYLIAHDKWELVLEGTWEEIHSDGVLSEAIVADSQGMQESLDQFVAELIALAASYDLWTEHDGEAGMVWFFEGYPYDNDDEIANNVTNWEMNN